MIPFLLSALLLVANPPEGGTVRVKGATFQAELARTDSERARGLMHRSQFARDRCMFFLYPADGHYSVWMKNCLISLDVLWVVADGTVVEIQENIPPCSPLRGDDCPAYGGTVRSRYFVEFAAGTFRRLGLKKGDRIGWDLQLPNGARVRGGTLAGR